MAHTHTHTDGHGDSMTNSAQWGRVGENCSNRSLKSIFQKIELAQAGCDTNRATVSSVSVRFFHKASIC